MLAPVGVILVFIRVLVLVIVLVLVDTVLVNITVCVVLNTCTGKKRIQDFSCDWLEWQQLGAKMMQRRYTLRYFQVSTQCGAENNAVHNTSDRNTEHGTKL